MYKSNKLNLFLNIFIIITCSITTIILFIKQNTLYTGYEKMFLLPLVYIICHIFFIKKVMDKYGISIFIAVYIIVSYSRFMVLPILVYTSGWYFGRSDYLPATDKFELAIFIMIYEIVCYSVAIFIGHRIILKNQLIIRRKLDFNYHTFIYLFFIILTFALLLIRPSALNYVSFMSVNSNFTSLQDLDTLTSVVILLLSLARYILYFVVVKYIIMLFHKDYPLLAFILVSGVTLINSFIFFGTNRSDFIFTFIISMVILVYLYGRYAIVLSTIFTFIVPIIVLRISSYRETATITKGTNVLVDITDYFQVYLAGIYNVAISLELPSRTGNIIYLIADVFRSAIGPNIFLKHLDIITSSQLFNYRIYLSSHSAQIIPMIGQGELYLSFIFSPLLGISFILIAIYFTKVIINSTRFEMIFILMLTSGRFGFVMAQNGNILINELTFTIPIFLILYFLNNKVVMSK